MLLKKGLVWSNLLLYQCCVRDNKHIICLQKGAQSMGKEGKSFPFSINTKSVLNPQERNENDTVSPLTTKGFSIPV